MDFQEECKAESVPNSSVTMTNKCCLFCQVSKPSLKKKELLGEFQRKGPNTDLFMKQYFEDPLKGAMKIPEAKFYKQGKSKDVPDPDLFADDHLLAHKQTIRNRQTEMDEEKIGQRFLKWCLIKQRTPALVLTGNEFVNYISGSTNIHEFLKENKLLGEYDVMCLTKEHGLFVCEVKSTFSSSNWWKKTLQKHGDRLSKMSLCSKH